MEIILGVMVFLVGVVLGLFGFKKIFSAKGDAENVQLSKRVEELTLDLKSIRDRNIELERKEGEFFSVSKEYEILKSERKDLQERVVDLEKNNSIMKSEKDGLEKNIKSYKDDLQKIQDSYKSEFKNLANEILKSKTESLKEASNESISAMLSPLKIKIDEFQKEVSDKYIKEAKERHSLQDEITKLAKLNMTITEETNNLTKALKSEVKKQGNWGEIKLELILEASGLEKGKEYSVQGGGMGLKGEDNQTQLPDVIVNLPENKHIIVDSKVSLRSYIEYVEASNDEGRDQASGKLLSALRAHIDGLSGKSYHFNEKLFTPEFTFLFFPIEGALSIVIDMEVPRMNQTLMQYAWDKKIIIVTPTTLMSTLKTIASIWKFEKQEKHAQKIAEQGGKIYDKFVGLISDFENIHKHLNNGMLAYDDAYKKLTSGKGNLISQVERMKELGAKAKKSLPEIAVD